jgi:hypothetical protein
MADYFWLFVIGGLIVWGVIGWIMERFGEASKYRELKPRLDTLEQKEREFHESAEKIKQELKSKEESLDVAKIKAREDLEKIAKQKSMGFPWLAEAYADYFALRDKKIADLLKSKKHPALTASQAVSAIKQEKKILVKENKVVTYKLNYLEKLFPWISEIIAESEDDEIPVRIDENDESNDKDTEDRVRDYLTPEEYKSLPSVERNQKALDRYIQNRNKSKWAIGRDYEMYVGHLFSQKGYVIEYKGIIDGFDDLGRDVIAKKGNEVCIIQCKHWAQYKEIHEKHIFQLFGTTMEYWLKYFDGHKKQKSFEDFSNMLNEHRLRPIFFTSTSLSARAKEMANALSIEIVEGEPLGEFPRIKCNLNSGEFGGETKIYHLPMDQQYDRTIIGDRHGEFFAFTVKEAEDAGFRRAFKHRF